MNHPQLADKKHCTGCMACADSCGQQAISCIVDEEGHYAYKVDEDKCVLCHRCEKVCPVVSGMVYGSNDLTLSRPYAVWSRNEVLRANATSGGVFPSIAKSVIEQGGVVFGAEQGQYYVKHCGVDQLGDIKRLQGSKYTQSKTEGVFMHVADALNQGRKVLFSGVGCQVAALLSFLKGNKNLDNLITLDLICGGVPSSFLIKRYIEKQGGNITAIASYRTKSKYELVIKDKNGKDRTIPTGERPLPLTGFTTGAAERYICYDCPFAKGHRLSDITIGDYWGNVLYPEQKAKGASVAIVHNEKGEKALSSANIEAHIINWRDFLPNNPRMVYGVGSIPKTRKNLSKAFATYSYERLLEDYANKGNIKRPWTVLNKALLVLKGKLSVKRRRKYVEQLLNQYGL